METKEMRYVLSLTIPTRWQCYRNLYCHLTFVYLLIHNQELLYLYGFVIDGNPDDYLMV
jgi:hypothetical protein